MQDKVNKYFTTKNVIFAVMLILFLIFLSKISNIALMFFGAFIISAALVPIADKMSKRIPRALAVTILIFLILGTFLLIVIPLLSFAIKKGMNILNNLPYILATIEAKLNFNFMGFSSKQMFDKLELSSIAPDFINDFLGDAINKSINVTLVIADILTTTIAVAIMVFYMCYDTKAMKEGFLAFFPTKMKRKAEKILTSITTRVGGYVLAQIIAMIFVGLVTTAGLLILGHKHAILLGFITCVFDIVPVVGPAIATIIGVLVAAQNSFLYVILTLIVYIVAQLLENQFLRPVVFGKFMDIHPLTIIISLLIGAKFLGAWGVVLGPAIASVVCVLVDELYIKPINKEYENREIIKRENR